MSEDRAEETIAAYAALVRTYHRTLDLVSERGLEEFDRHLRDARAYARAIRRLAGERATVVDVGSGVGLPAVVVAAMLPEARVILVERRRRRVAFLELAVARLGLRGATVFAGDVRALTGVRADAVTAQAVASLGDLVRLTRHLHGDPCFLLSRRGPGWRGELPDVARALGAPLTWRESGAAEGPTSDAASGTAEAEVLEEPLETRGSLVALRLPGGSACPSSG